MQFKGKKLIRFKDNTFCWNDNGCFSDIVSLPKAIAQGTWHLKIDRKEIDKALSFLGESKTHHSVALFSSLGHFLYADQIDMEEEEYGK